MLLLIIFLFHYYHLAEFLLCLGANPQQDRRGSNQVDARQLTSTVPLIQSRRAVGCFTRGMASLIAGRSNKLWL